MIQADTNATDSFNKRVIDIEINPSDVYQEVKGFGGAFTDAAAITAASLGSETAKKIVRDFYSPSGLSFSLGRLVIGGSDFSTRKYTYNDDGNSSLDEDNYDFNLDHFSLQDEDIKFKVNIFVAELSDTEDVFFSHKKEMQFNSFPLSTLSWTL